ncbi:MAG: hypothetical protein A2268_00700 [Candidatus Raymondbacteria bacterium RifOxyA12_full_50_37]|uniref:Uncharacterized protein n=1 Tax=Candidatus Raymondbacteria bacterium RIFOXYD12_FULL_49_13 TaxID=1817890 RepID=A0A1F7F9X0_UNCRA|nr:MAG: hypothetical protein A2268_00700 [Candidatus Raymondbacteria bacterium RifOxyA12_full_50_37]OGJ90049.1 MAG: hypothetical protein A2248_19030 [Candidatus Raymondbacteria bacterium RIFOXYA2_FULL_49_16]OGJ96689.1 MAG: hypothetical protein A2350_01875 [Candidatus Raymondbacteria bacterium RifOxyB12_full_50_8]OGJ96733.1 MAG: hypothetical protein A2453_06155 [Candidatus Raymondbacteria bacterium RIFOXYC2_FULL_50_21]OGK03484.1 MAG: hypothetical protein A2519_15730 [Candidatus Raymondbacteria b
MVISLIKGALFALVVLFFLRMLSASRTAARVRQEREAREKRISTEGCEIKDASFSEIDETKGG